MKTPKKIFFILQKLPNLESNVNFRKFNRKLFTSNENEEEIVKEEDE